MPPALLLFDVDGTLMLAHGMGMHSMRVVAERLFGDTFRWEGVKAGGNLDPLIFSEAARHSGIEDIDQHHETFREHYVAELEAQLLQNAHKIEILPGVVELIDSLHDRATNQRDIVLGLLTGNYTASTAVKLRSIGIDLARFTITALGDEAPTRADLVRLAMDRYEEKYGTPADPRRTIIIGDTTRDVACAKAHGCICVAVCTGMSTEEELREAGADVIVPNLADASPLLALL